MLSERIAVMMLGCVWRNLHCLERISAKTTVYTFAKERQRKMVVGQVKKFVTKFT